VSDEIHCDLTYRGITHIPLPIVKPEYSGRIITCTAPSKTFNLAGLQISNIIIQDDGLPKKFRKALMKNGIIDPNSFAAVAMEAAYTHGAEWLNELMDYVRGNLEYMKKVFSESLPKIRVVEPEGTYLVWADFRGFGLDYMELLRVFIEEAKVAPGQGNIYGPEGEGFMRFNLACPRQTLQEGIERIIKAFSKYI
jgi:cystathionine beta-lyase